LRVCNRFVPGVSRSLTPSDRAEKLLSTKDICHAAISREFRPCMFDPQCPRMDGRAASVRQ
jgi:hypothetical protein